MNLLTPSRLTTVALTIVALAALMRVEAAKEAILDKGFFGV
tara:strand:+ start:490 stop:612 length:123 start_codon:yes stop_codon:yes gene_type:complete